MAFLKSIQQYINGLELSMGQKIVLLVMWMTTILCLFYLPNSWGWSAVLFSFFLTPFVIYPDPNAGRIENYYVSPGCCRCSENCRTGR